jgi:hypothetical protein
MGGEKRREQQQQKENVATNPNEIMDENNATMIRVGIQAMFVEPAVEIITALKDNTESAPQDTGDEEHKCIQVHSQDMNNETNMENEYTKEEVVILEPKQSTLHPSMNDCVNEECRCEHDTFTHTPACSTKEPII